MNIKRKAYFIFVVLVLLLAAAVNSMVHVSGDAEYVAAAGQQSIYKLDVAKARGAIYDCNLTPLTGTTKRRMAAIAPTIETVGTLEKATEGKYRERLALALSDGKPFTLPIDRYVKDPNVDLFNIPKRYAPDQLAPHVVGYLDSLGQGVAGIELAMNDALSQYGGEISVYYQVDALGRVIAGAQRLVVDTLEDASGGVALTLDGSLQAMVQEASQGLGKGAVVVTEAPDCKIRALVSLPGYDPTDIGSAAQSEDAPLLNRAFCAYAPGSVFKLAVAAAQLESGTVLDSFECTGSLNAGGMLFHCYDGQPHGAVDLRGAIEKSCNCYFISAARATGGQAPLNIAYNLGLGVSQEFGRGLVTSAGTLPQGSELENARALANFSFGQGDLTVTPVQMCGLMNAIASDGVYQSPKLIEGLVNGEGELVPQHPVSDISRQAMSAKSAQTLQDCLKSAAKSGTGASGAPEGLECGIKTGTAQTGAYENGRELSHFWYCGFVGDGSGKRYCITVLKESAAEDGGATGRVFRTVAEGIFSQ